jgi:hypothetical protein
MIHPQPCGIFHGQNSKYSPWEEVGVVARIILVRWGEELGISSDINLAIRYQSLGLDFFDDFVEFFPLRWLLDGLLSFGQGVIAGLLKTSCSRKESVRVDTIYLKLGLISGGLESNGN